MFDPLVRSPSRRAALVDLLTAVMDELSALAVDPASTRANLAEAMVLERARSWAPAQQARVLAGLEVAEPRDHDPESPNLPSPRATTPHEIALVLRVSTAAARGRVEVARGLVEHFPGVLAAAADGTLPWWQARRALEETTDLDPACRAAVDRELSDHARRGRNPARFTTRLAAVILDVTGDTAEQAHLHGLAERAVWVDPRPDGTVAVAGTLAAEDGAVFLAMVDRLRDTPLSLPPAGWPVDDRTADQRRADTLNGLSHAVIAGLDTAGSLDPAAAAHRALTAVLAQATDAGPASRPPARRRRRGTQVLVTVSAETLLGISDAPGDLAGHGPITAGHARRLSGAADSWRRLLTDPATGALLDIGRTRYTPTAPIADHVLIRSNRQCVRPGCPREADHLDHAHPWADNGVTSAGNLSGLCLGDHRARHTGWTVTIDRTGATSMTTTHGFTAGSRPHDHRPADRRPPDPGPAPASRDRDRAPGRPPTTPLGRLRALFPAADHTEFPVPSPGGVGDPQTGDGWLTDMHRYITTSRDRARAHPVDAPPPRDPPREPLYGPDDPPPF